MLRHRLFILGSLASAVITALVACGGSESGVGSGTTDDSGTEGSSGDDGATSSDSAPGDDGGTEITDGGSNFDPDAGDDGGLPDGGRCNELDNTATAVTSTCISKRPVLAGGVLASGKYFLTAVRDLGTKPFCAGPFIPTGLKQTLDLTVTGTTAIAETVSAVGGAGPGARHATTTFTTTATNTSPMNGQQTCPVVGAGGPVAYESGISIATSKQSLVMILPYGKGEALYTFEKQP